MGMEDLVEFLQVKLEQDFGYHDDSAIDYLHNAIDELKKHKMELPGRADSVEFPKKPFGVFIEPKFEKIPVTEKVITNGDDMKWAIKPEATMTTASLSVGHLAERNINACFIDNDTNSSVVDPLSSRNSLAETSQTSTADLSIVSGFSSPSTTLSRRLRMEGTIGGSPMSTSSKIHHLRRTHSLYNSIDVSEDFNLSTEEVNEYPAQITAKTPESVKLFVISNEKDVNKVASEEEEELLASSSPVSQKSNASSIPLSTTNGDITPTNPEDKLQIMEDHNIGNFNKIVSLSKPPIST